MAEIFDVIESHETSWGKPPIHDDVRALRRYNRLLQQLSAVGEGLIYAGLVVWAAATLAMVFTGNFENLIFKDGTTLSCILDGNTGEITNVR